VTTAGEWEIPPMCAAGFGTEQDINALAGGARRLQGEKAALAEVPQVYGRRKIFGWTYQWRRFWRRWQTVILLVMLAVLLGIWLALLQRR